MKISTARLFLPSLSQTFTVYPGCILGRLPGAGVHVPDPRVSEAHALVSIRDGQLRLLTLRGKLLFQGEAVESVALEQGRLLELVAGVQVFVEDVQVASHTLMLCGADPGPQEISSATYSLVLTDRGSLRLVPEYVDGAPAHLWRSGDELWFRLNGKEPEPLKVGKRWVLPGGTVHVVAIPTAGTLETVAGEPREDEPLTIIARYTTVHLRRGKAVCVVTGRPAALLSELVRFGGKPVPWDTVAGEIWGTAVDRITLRQSWDRTLGRLREQLRVAEIRDDLVHPDGTGNIELVLRSGDQLVDET